MTFDINKFDKLSQAGITGLPTLWTYLSASDNLATIGASAYFNTVDDRLAIGDEIFIKGSDGSNRYGVTAISPNVTIAANPDVVAPDTIVNDDINSAAAIAFSKLASLTSGQILVGSAGNVPTAVAMSGDATIVASGALTIANSAITNAKVSASAAIDFAKLAALASGNILVGSAGNVATSVVMSGDATIVASGALTIANNAITTAKILNANVTLAKLASGITPSHIVKFAGKENNGGGSATVAITVTGVTTSHIVFAQIQASTNAVTVQKVTPTADTITVLLSGDPGAGTVISYQALLAAA